MSPSHLPQTLRRSVLSFSGYFIGFGVGQKDVPGLQELFSIHCLEVFIHGQQFSNPKWVSDI